MKKMYELKITYEDRVYLFTSEEKAQEFAGGGTLFALIYPVKVNIFTYYFYKLIGR